MVNSPPCWLSLGTKTANSIERGISDGFFAGSAPSTDELETKVINSTLSKRPTGVSLYCCTILHYFTEDVRASALGRVECRAENRTRDLPKRMNKEWSGGFYSASGRSPLQEMKFVR